MNAGSHNERFLELVAGMMADGLAVNISVISRAKYTATVVFKTRSIVLHSTALLLDLCIAARLLRFRQQAREQLKDGSLSDHLRAEWVEITLTTLSSDFPQISRLPGYFDLKQTATWPTLSWSEVAFDDLNSDAMASGRPTLSRDQTLEITGAEGDLHFLWEAVASGRYVMEHWDAIREVSIVTLPLTVSSTATPAASFERYEDDLKSASTRERIHNIMKCSVRRAEESPERRFHELRQKFGARIDSSRLVDAVAMRGSGVFPRIFQVRQNQASRHFDPTQHFAVIAFDTNIFEPGSINDPAFNRKWLATVIEVYRQLEIDFSVVAFSDHIVELPDGKGMVMAHMPAVLKRVDEDADGKFLNRFWSVSDAPPGIPGGIRCCFHALQLRSVLEVIREQSRTQDYSHVSLMLIAPRGMPQRGCFHEPHFLSRTANTMDDLFRDFARANEADIESLCIIPEDLKDYARRGGYTASMYTAGALG